MQLSFFENQYTGAMLAMTMKPDLNLRVTCSPACSASTKARMSYSFPSGSGASGGMLSFEWP